jgi:hypothetical protein
MDNTKNIPQDFPTKMDIVKTLVAEWGFRESQFYNSSTNKSVERFWTYNRCLQYLFKLRKDYVRTEHGYMHKDFYKTYNS